MPSGLTGAPKAPVVPAPGPSLQDLIAASLRANPYSAGLAGGLGTGSTFTGNIGAGGTQGYLPPVRVPGLTDPGAGTTPDTSTEAGTGGNTVDYESIIANDPILNQFKTSVQGDQAARDAQAKAGVQRAVIGFGEVPSDLQGFDSYIDPQTQELARQSTSSGMSTVARLGATHQDNVRSLVNALTARGILRSGETGWQAGREDLRFSQGQYDARAKLADYFAGLQQALAQGRRQDAADLAAALNAAALRAYQLYGGTGGGKGKAPPVTPPPGEPPPSPPVPDPHHPPAPLENGPYPDPLAIDPGTGQPPIKDKGFGGKPV